MAEVITVCHFLLVPASCFCGCCCGCHGRVMVVVVFVSYRRRCRHMCFTCVAPHRQNAMASHPARHPKGPTFRAGRNLGAGTRQLHSRAGSIRKDLLMFVRYHRLSQCPIENVHLIFFGITRIATFHFFGIPWNQLGCIDTSEPLVHG